MVEQGYLANLRLVIAERHLARRFSLTEPKGKPVQLLLGGPGYNVMAWL
jgi:hypothetical protein